MSKRVQRGEKGEQGLRRENIITVSGRESRGEREQKSATKREGAISQTES